MPVVQINGIGIHYQESGDRDKPTIVFAHPLMWGPDTFAELLTEIARDARLLTVDLHGHGLSGYRESMTLEEMVEDYYGLLQELGLGKVAWFGYGIGGMIGMRVALAHPTPLALVLMATSARPEAVNNESVDPPPVENVSGRTSPGHCRPSHEVVVRALDVSIQT